MATPEVISIVPAEPKTPVEHGELLERALELADEICDATHESFEVSQAALAVAVADRALLARTVNLLVDLLDDKIPPKVASCFWCWAAAGQTAEAWCEQPRRSIEETREHALTCPHRPGAPAINAVASELTKLIAQTIGGQRPPTRAQLISATRALSDVAGQLTTDNQEHAVQIIAVVHQLLPSLSE